MQIIYRTGILSYRISMSDTRSLL